MNSNNLPVRDLDQFDLEAAAEGAAIKGARRMGSRPLHQGARTMGARMNYRKTAPATVAVRERRQTA